MDGGCCISRVWGRQLERLELTEYPVACSPTVAAKFLLHLAYL
jgi:hypothetical protein